MAKPLENNKRPSAAWALDAKAGARQHIPLIVDREAFLENLCRTFESVAHVGCADSPYTIERISSGTLLHSRIQAIRSVVGFDIDAGGLAILQSNFPNGRFVHLDITGPIPSEHSGVYDLVLAGEVLEHTNDAGRFLAGCRRLLRPGGTLCVTVPNACSPKIGLRSLIGRESVHPDHRVYYGPRTLRQTLVSAGFDVHSLATYFAQSGGLGRFANTWLTLSHRLFQGPVGEGLIATAVPSRGRVAPSSQEAFSKADP